MPSSFRKNPAFLQMFVLPLFLAACLWDSPEESPEYLPIDDSMYPYADVPRIAIEVEDFHEIRDRETEFPANFQVYGKDSPESGVLHLTVRGRGNSSFKMPKYGLKLEFDEKVSLFGMPKNRDWALIPNFGDKTHLRNFIMFRLSTLLSADYTPRSEFVELYLNRKYMGLYLLAENVKVGKNRVNIAKGDSSFLFEKETSKKLDPPYIETSMGNQIHIKYPKNLTQKSESLALEHLNGFESYLLERGFRSGYPMDDWVDIEDLLLYYWVQEFAKNEDGNFVRSVFFSWEYGSTIHFGPLWDFDLGFGNASRDECKSHERWYIRNYGWFYYMFRDESVRLRAKEFWLENRDVFRSVPDSVALYAEKISKVIKNEYRRWPVMKNTENWALKDPYEDYDEALDVLVEWMRARFEWIEENL